MSLQIEIISERKPICLWRKPWYIGQSDRNWWNLKQNCFRIELAFPFSQLSQQDEEVSWKFLFWNNPLPPELYREPFFGTKKSKTNSKKHFATVTLSELRFLIDVSSLSVSAVSDSRFAAVLFKIYFKRFPILEQPLVAWAMGIPKDSGIAFTSFEKN